MNKKRVALALAAALSVNTLMVTVGQVGQQAVVAHAVDGKLTNQDDINKLNGLKIKALKSEVKTDENGKTSLTFPDLNGNIKSLTITDGKFKHAAFAERADFEKKTTDLTATWNETTQTLDLGEVKTPGIYTGEVEVTLGNGTKEKYTISLRKTPVDTLSYDVEVGVGQLTVKNLTFNNGGENLDNVITDSNLELYHTGNKTTAKPKKGATTGEYSFNLLDLANAGKVKEGDVLELRASYGKGNEYKVVSKILLVKQDKPEIKNALMTNETTFSTTIEDKIKTDFGVTSAANTGSSVTVGGQTLFTYEQTMSGSTDPLGAKLDVTLGNGNKDVNLAISGTVSTAGANSVYGVELKYGNDAAAQPALKSTGLIGDYSLTISNATVTYFDAMSGLTVSAVIDANSNTQNYLGFLDSSNQPAELHSTDITPNPKEVKLVNLVDNLQHGYTSIAGSFNVNAEEDWKNIQDGNKSLQAQSTPTSLLAKIEKDDSKKDLKVSLIVSADTLDGVGSGVTFKRTSESEGELKFTSNVNNGTLTVDGATVTGSNGTYKVQFNTNVPSSFTWKLEVGGKTIDGEVSTGKVDAVNVDSVSVENLSQIDNQFKVNSKFNLFDKEIPTVDTLNSNRVTLEQFGKGSHTLNVTTSTGKYQGTYKAGVVVEQQSFVISLKSKNNTSSTATLTVQGTNIDKDALNNVTKATLQYKEKNSNTWRNDVNVDLKNIQSQKQFDLTKSNLSANTEYDFRIEYQVKNGTTTNTAYTNTVTVRTSTSSSSNSGSNTITGNGSSSTSGTSTGSTNVNVTSNNLTVNGSIIGVRIPTSIKYDSGKTPVVAAIKYKDNNGKTVTERNDQFKGVSARFNGESIEVEGLVPGKEYVEISVDYTDNNGKVKTIVLKNFKFNTNIESDNYLANIYNVVFTRPADETGYLFHLNNLKGKKVSLREFVLNMLTEKEFIETYNTTEKKIEALYNAIVNRKSDENGKKFWVEEYRKVLAVYGSESTALKAIAERMVNENELKALAEKLNFVW